VPESRLCCKDRLEIPSAVEHTDHDPRCRIVDDHERGDGEEPKWKAFRNIGATMPMIVSGSYFIAFSVQYGPQPQRFLFPELERRPH